MNRGDLQKLTGLSSTTIAKIGKNESVTFDVVDRIATALEVPIYNVVESIQESPSSNSICWSAGG